MILLPDDKDGLKDLENNILKIKLCEISSKMTDYKVTVKLPRFKLEQSLELKETLSNVIKLNNIENVHFYLYKFL